MLNKFFGFFAGKKTVTTGIGMIAYNLLISFIPELKETLDPTTINNLFAALMIIFVRLGIKKVEV